MCGHRFRLKQRRGPLIRKVWHLYAHGKQTYSQIGEQCGRSTSWVQKNIDRRLLHSHNIPPCHTPILIDAVFFGRESGLLVFRSPTLEKNLRWYEIQSERVEDYRIGIEGLLSIGFEITGIVVDGKPGVLQALERMGFPVQMCHFHQIQIVSRYTTRSPRLPAAKELLHLVRLLPKTDEESFRFWLQEWHAQWKTFLDEKTLDPIQNRFRFTHIRLRKAYRSLTRHLPYLYTYHHHRDLPNTNNSLEGVFSQLKAKVGIHRGLKQKRKVDLIHELLR